MLNLLSLNYEFPPIGGGGGNAHRHLLQEFTRFPDLRVTFISSTCESQVLHKSLGPNVEIFLLPLRKKEFLYWRRGEILQYLDQHYRFLRSHLRDHTYDLCHTFFGFPCGFLSYGCRSRVPYVISVRGSDVPGYNERFTWDYIFLKPLLRRIYAKSLSNITNSRGLQNLFEQQFPSLTAEVIPNGIDTKTFQPAEQETHNEPWIISVARLIPRKGMDLLLSACRLLKSQGIAFVCHIVGDGPEEDHLKQTAYRWGMAAQMVFYGRLERAAVADLLPQCDLFVLPSYAEGMSNAALEALACGLPLVLTDTGGSQELVGDHNNGMIVPTGDINALAAALGNLLLHPEMRKEMGVQSRRLAEQFSWASVARQYHDLYYRVLGRTPET